MGNIPGVHYIKDYKWMGSELSLVCHWEKTPCYCWVFGRHVGGVLISDGRRTPSIIPPMLARNPTMIEGTKGSSPPNCSTSCQERVPRSIASKAPRELALRKYSPAVRGTKAATSVIEYEEPTIS